MGMLQLTSQPYTLWTRRHASTRCKMSQEAPEPAGRWPVIGHIPVLAKKQLLVRTLAELADQYGPVYTLWIGVHRTLVVSNWEMAKECFTINDRNLSNRAQIAAGKYLGYNFANFGFSPYGPYWRAIRKMATQEILCPRQLEEFKHVRITEIDLSMKQLFNLCMKNNKLPTKVEMKQWFGDLTFNNVVMMVAGKRYFGTNVAGDESEARQFREAIEKLFYVSGMFVPSDAFPILEPLDIGGTIRLMKKTAAELDILVAEWVAEHRSRRASDQGHQDKDFIDVMLSRMEKSPVPDCDPETAIKATALSLILAGTDTASVTLTWALALLLMNQHILKKAQEELDNFIGQARNVDESDMKNLPYIQAVIKETLRLYPPAPLAVPHQAMEDCKIGGYHVPAGARVIFNIWKIQHDPTVWQDPFEFRPERFLTTHKNVDVKGQNYELIPFGSGRRICPGISLAMHVMNLTLARLIHGFCLETPRDEPIDMAEGLGLTIPKATPLNVLFTPRLPSRLYE